MAISAAEAASTAPIPHVGVWKRFVRAKRPGTRAAVLAARARERQRLQQSRGGEVRGRGGGEEQQRARRLEGGEQPPVPHARPGHLRQERRVGWRQADVEGHSQNRDPHRQDSDYAHGEPDRALPEQTSVAAPELPELGDCVRRCLDSGGERHRQRHRQ
jgi:hypothetical protein